MIAKLFVLQVHALLLGTETSSMPTFSLSRLFQARYDYSIMFDADRRVTKQHFNFSLPTILECHQCHPAGLDIYSMHGAVICHEGALQLTVGKEARVFTSWICAFLCCLGKDRSGPTLTNDSIVVILKSQKEFRMVLGKQEADYL